MKKVLTIAAIGVMITVASCNINPFASQETQDKAELKRLIAKQNDLTAQIRAKVDTIKAYQQVDKMFDAKVAPTPAAPAAPSKPDVASTPTPAGK